MGSVEKVDENQGFVQPVADGKDIVIDEIDELMIEDEKDIIEEPNLVEEPRMPESETDQLLEGIQKMNPEDRNRLINLLAEKNVNPEKLNFNNMSKQSFLKMRLREKINQKRMGRINKSARTRQLAKDMMKNQSDSKEEGKVKEDDRNIDDLVAMIEGSSKKKNKKKNKKLQKLKQKMMDESQPVNPVNKEAEQAEQALEEVEK